MKIEEIYAAADKAGKLCQNREYLQSLEIYSALMGYDKEYVFARGQVYLEMGDYFSAIEDFNQMIAFTPPKFMADLYYLFPGICYWYLGQPDETVNLWYKSLTTPFTDAAGGVVPPGLLLYAAERLDDTELRKEAIRLLRKHARRKLTEWPGAIVPFLLGKIDETEVEKQLQLAEVEPLRSRWQCQADFFIALRALREGSVMKFETYMRRCAENTHGFSEPEHYLARWEVAQDFPKQPFTMR
jgi:tetratricopeptide (TPR) repeat protein